MKTGHLLSLLLSASSVLVAQTAATPITGDVSVRMMQQVDSSSSRPNQLFMGVVVSAKNSNLSVGDNIGMLFEGGSLHIVRATFASRRTRTTSIGAVASSIPAGGTVCFGKCDQADPTNPAPAGAATRPSMATGSDKAQIVALIQAANTMKLGEKYTDEQTKQLSRLWESRSPDVSALATFVSNAIATEMISVYPKSSMRISGFNLRKRCTADLLADVNGNLGDPAKSPSCKQLKKNTEPD